MVLPNGIELPQEVILPDPTPTIGVAASINKLQVNHHDGIPVQPNIGDEDGGQSHINLTHKGGEVDYMKSNKSMSPLPTYCIGQVYTEEDILENIITHLVLTKKKHFNYRTLLGEIM